MKEMVTEETVAKERVAKEIVAEEMVARERVASTWSRDSHEVRCAKRLALWHLPAQLLHTHDQPSANTQQTDSIHVRLHLLACGSLPAPVCGATRLVGGGARIF